MRSHSMVCFALIAALFSGDAAAENLKKSYSAATLPGTFAKCENKYQMPDGTSGTNLFTYIRLEDNGERVAVEVDTSTKSGPGAGSITRQLSVMEKGFDMLKDGLEYMSHVEYLIYQPGDGEAMLDTNGTAEIIRAGALSYRNAVTFKGSEKMSGRQCDHYSYAMRSGGPNPTVYEGEIWLDATVPFGIVRNKQTMKDASGKIQTTSDERLIDSGKGAGGSSAMIALIPAAGAEPEPGAVEEKEDKTASSRTLPLEKAYMDGTIYLKFEVVQGSGGKNMLMKIGNETSQAMTLLIPQGNLSLACGGIPVETLNISIEKGQSLSLEADAVSPPIEVRQTGKRGVSSGKFELSTYQGSPFFEGKVEVGPLKD